MTPIGQPAACGSKFKCARFARRNGTDDQLYRNHGEQSILEVDEQSSMQFNQVNLESCDQRSNSGSEPSSARESRQQGGENLGWTTPGTISRDRSFPSTPRDLENVSDVAAQVKQLQSEIRGYSLESPFTALQAAVAARKSAKAEQTRTSYQTHGMHANFQSQPTMQSSVFSLAPAYSRARQQPQPTSVPSAAGQRLLYQLKGQGLQTLHDIESHRYEPAPMSTTLPSSRVGQVLEATTDVEDTSRQYSHPKTPTSDCSTSDTYGAACQSTDQVQSTMSWLQPQLARQEEPAISVSETCPGRVVSDASKESNSILLMVAPLGSQAMPTVGSQCHRLHACKPCAFHHKGRCQNGVDCVFCHLCSPGEKKKRKQEKQQWLRGKFVGQENNHVNVGSVHKTVFQ